MGVTYYPIDETAAKRAHDANSYSDYKPGYATERYRSCVDQAAELAEKQKKLVDPMYHEKIDGLLDAYARRLADNWNERYRIDARVPSILVAGGSNFPVRKKEKQNAARDKNMAEWQEIQKLLGKIRGVGKGGISADDPEAVRKLKEKLARLKQEQESMKAVNAYYKKNKTLEGCPGLTWEQIERLKAAMSRSWRKDPKPYESYVLSNNNAVIRQTARRIEELTRVAETEFSGWTFEGGRAEINRADNRLQLFFDGKPDAAVRAELKSCGFRWAPSVGAWQRQLNEDVFHVADKIAAICPLSGELPSELQVKQQTETAVSETPNDPSGWKLYVIADLMTWSTNAEQRSPLERFSSFEEARARFDELRGEPYNSEAAPPNPEGRPYARLTLGVESGDGMSAADILQVREGQNYLVDDFTRMERLRNDPDVMELLSRTAREIGFDRVKGYVRTESGYEPAPDVPFEEWDNPWFESHTAGRVASIYYDLVCETDPQFAEEHPDRAKEISLLVYEMQYWGVGRIALSLARIKDRDDLDDAVRNRLSRVIRELTEYKDRVGPLPGRTKGKKPRQTER